MARRGKKHTISGYVDERTNDWIEILVVRWGKKRGRVIELLIEAGLRSAAPPTSDEMRARERAKELETQGGVVQLRGKESVEELDRRWRDSNPR